MQRQRSKLGRAGEKSSHHAASHSSADMPSATRSSNGQPLSPAARAQFEPLLGHSFAEVRVHLDAHADDVTRALDARAVASGDELFFAHGAFAPESARGRHLLAHELAHVAQQSRSGVRRGRAVSRADDHAEHEATAAADAVMMGQPATVAAAPAAVSRQEKGEEEESWLSKAAWFAGEHLPGIGDAVEATHGIGEAITSSDTMKTIKGIGEGISGTLGQAAEFGGYEGIFGGAGLFGEGGGIMSALSGGSLIGEGGAIGTLMGAGAEGGIGGVAGTILPSLFGGAEGAAALPGVAGMSADAALLGGGLEGAAALGPAAAVIGAGAAGVGAGIGLDKGANWLGQKITGDEKGDYSISGGLASLMTGADEMGTGALRSMGVLDESKPAYTQTLGWKLANLFD